MASKCECCIEKSPQAERAHQAALGRMYSTKEFVALLKKVESGALVEVVRCKDCKWSISFGDLEDRWIQCRNLHGRPLFRDDGFCSYGERREGE